MLEIIKDKKFIFFDVGYTLDRPISGDWQFTNKFNEYTKNKIDKRDKKKVDEARVKGIAYFKQHHLVKTIEEEMDVYRKYYEILSNELDLGLTKADLDDIVYDICWNMDNYEIYPNVKETLEELSKYYKLGIISDTWPSIKNQLNILDIYKYFTTYTYSYTLGVFKPDPKMFIDALSKCGYDAKDTVFIDDQVTNIAGAEKFGITPILIAANKASDIETKYTKIYSIKDLLK